MNNFSHVLKSLQLEIDYLVSDRETDPEFNDQLIEEYQAAIELIKNFG